ncbi:cyclophilin-like domain-containing protein [Podospora australis]|uniref:Peptidyl-prolyl cis-trans isomerase n=1 Tax=Podospora australis TaxID=1536484 RepID=A0AAN6WQ03_9PEZI|nr:cyclophilin-like domain-containing protein [Podospora australis]
MSVLIETSAGDIVIDLLVDYAPKMCENFLKLCKVKYYNFSPIHSIQKSFSFQTGDPLGPMSAQSDGGTSIWGLLSGKPEDKTFPALFHPKLKHLERGTVSMATAPHPSDKDTRLAGSQFIVTLGDNTDYLDDKAAIFGKVVEGFDVLEKINEAIVDERGHPLVDIRIKHTVVLDDPYPDPAGLREPSASPPPTKVQLATVRIAEGEELVDAEASEEAAAEAERRKRERDAAAQALTLEMMGDLPFAEVKPPENVLFVCKLNPVTTDEDLELIFSRFGKILSCEVIRDAKTGDSLQYAFIEFEDKKSCEEAYFKMDSVLIDDRRIHVDFSQSVSRLSEVWRSDTNNKRKNAAAKRGGGGWGGVQELEKWRKYRNEEGRYEEDDDNYKMVHGMEDMRGRHSTHDKEPDSRRDGPSGHDDNRKRASPDRRGSTTDKYSSSRSDHHRDYRRRDTEQRRSRSPRRDIDRPGNPGRGSRDRDRDDENWSRRPDRRDQDRDGRRGGGRDSRDKDRDRERERDRYRGRGEYGGR